MRLYSRFWIYILVLTVFFGVFLSGQYFGEGQKVSAQSTKENSPVVSQSKLEEAYRANNLGVAYLEQFKHKEGAEEFKRALSFDPQLTIAQINLAIALFNVPDVESARREAEKAAKLAPNRAEPLYILGLIAKNQNRTQDAIAFFQRVLAIDPRDVGANVNLGQIYTSQRKYAEAAALFRTALDAEPYNATAMYNLATALLREGKREEGQDLINRFQALRQSGAATTIGQNYLEQGRYAEAVASTGAEVELVDKTQPKVSFQNAEIGLLNQKPQTGVLSGYLKGLKPKSKYEILNTVAGGATLFDFDNDGDLDLVKSNNSIGRIRKISRSESIAPVAASFSLYRNDGGRFVNVTKTAGDLAKSGKNLITAIVAGDYDNDGLQDLFVVGYEKLQLFRNLGKGRFEDVSEKAKLPELAKNYLSISCAFVDADHDGDLDIFIAGYTFLDAKAEVNDFRYPLEFQGAPNLLLRNNGVGAFTDISDAAKVNQSKENNHGLEGRSVAVIPTDYDNRRDVDLLVLNRGGRPNLFRNLRDGTFRDVAEEVGLNQKGNWTSAAAGDFNKDGYTDFFFGAGWDYFQPSDGKGILAVSDGRGKFMLKEAPLGTEYAASAQFLDYDNDGLLDLIVNTDKGFVVARNLGDRFAEASSEAFKTKSGANLSLAGSRQFLAGDVDGDGDEDLFAFSKSGTLNFLKNVGGNKNNSETLNLTGRVSNRTGIGAKIEMRAGSLVQKLESYSASPAPAPADIHFGLGKREKPDAIRVIWTSGVIQSEIEFPEEQKIQTAKSNSPIKIEELDRKPSSCPYLYTWNGEKFEFITDFMGGGEMGGFHAHGVYNYPDSDEFVRIAPDKLKPKNGKYEIRVTNELEEVLFIDNLKLVAVEHDADTEAYPNEGLGIPNAEKRILYTTRREHAPLSAVDTNGENILPQIENLDRKFYDSFKSLNIRGYAEPHNLTLNLDDKEGFNGRTLLLLTGWTDYAFSSDNLAASQSGKSLFLPKLQVKNKKGEWETVIESIGIPIGRPQTVVVDLTGRFLSDSREVRIVTNFKTYWDKIAVDTSDEANVKTTELQPSQADLRERGFSEETKFGEMIVPSYENVLNDGRWKYFSGSFTRLDDVKPLLNSIDDVFVISKTGDELVLSFDALPAPPAGKKYTFLLFVDGYSKEMDINSGSPEAVYPLPFKKMRKYPYGEGERFPMTEEKRRIYDEYTTRTVKSVFPRIETALIK